MKKIILAIMLFSLGGCLVAGDFAERRNRLHEIGNNPDYCEKHPDRCVQGVPW